jgi:hypothetical protein
MRMATAVTGHQYPWLLCLGLQLNVSLQEPTITTKAELNKAMIDTWNQIPQAMIDQFTKHAWMRAFACNMS